MIMEKPSCIVKLKELTNSLTDRDTDIKKCMSKVKEIISTNLSDKDKILKIKEICKDYGN